MAFRPSVRQRTKYAHPQFTRDCYCTTCEDGAKSTVSISHAASFRFPLTNGSLQLRASRNRKRGLDCSHQLRLIRGQSVNAGRLRGSNISRLELSYFPRSQIRDLGHPAMQRPRVFRLFDLLGESRFRGYRGLPLQEKRRSLHAISIHSKSLEFGKTAMKGTLTRDENIALEYSYTLELHARSGDFRQFSPEMYSKSAKTTVFRVNPRGFAAGGP